MEKVQTSDGQAAREVDRMKGALFGLAVGDAVGTTLEFCRPGRFTPINDMVGGGPFSLDPGQWTDDTSMTLCLAESLVQMGAFDPVDQLRRYVQWWKEGHLSSTGRCFDIGNQTRIALQQFIDTGRPFCGPTGERSAGNGSLMRLAPVPIAFCRKPSLAIIYSGESSQTTHGNAECVAACRYFGGLIVGAINGASKDTLLSPHYSPVADQWKQTPLPPKIAAVAAGSSRHRQPPAIRGRGYVVDCLEAALWAFATTDSFADAILAAANLGDDADTTAAVTGQIAGPFYGLTDIPPQWLAKLAMREVIEELTEGLVMMAERQTD